MPGGPGIAGPGRRWTPRSTCPSGPPRPPCWSRTGSAAARPPSTPTPATLAARGFVALAWSARGFGASTGQIALNSPDYEVADARGAGRLARRAPRGDPGRPRRPARRHHRRVLRRGDLAAARRLRPAGRRAGAGDHLERPGPGAVPQRRRPHRAAGGHPGARRLRAGRGVQAGLGRDLLLRRARAHRAGPVPARPRAARRRPARPSRQPAPTGRPRHSPAGPATCGRFTAGGLRRLHRGGHHRPALPRHRRAAARARRRPRVTDRITAPTLLVQGEQDTLFGLDQADANARQIAAAGGPGQGGLVRRRPRRRPARRRRPRRRSASGSLVPPGTARSPIAARTPAPASPTPSRAGCGRPASTPTEPHGRRRRTTPACPGTSTLGTPRPSPAWASRRSWSTRPGATRPRSPRCPGSAARWAALGGRLTAFTAELPGQSAQFRLAGVGRAAAGRRRARGSTVSVVRGCPGSPRRPRRCCSPRPTR